MSAHCIIVDDEPLAIQVIKSYVEKIPKLKLVASCRSAIEAIELLQQQQIDLIFLDIQMPGLTGFEMIKSINNPPAVIFTTAHRDFAADAYDINAVDYLLKPISFPRFIKAVNKYFDQFQQVSDTIPKKIIPIRANRKTYNINVGKILIIEGLKDYVKVHLEDQKMLITKAKLSDLEGQLRDSGFIRVHKSFLIQWKKISSYTSESIDIMDFEIPIGRTYREQVMAQLGSRNPD